MAAGGEMRELAHDPSGTHSHDLHVDELDAELAAAGEQNQGGAKTLHVLLHFSHCCGATAALLSVLKPLPVMPLSDRLAIAKAPIPLQARLTRSEEHTSELQSLMRISYAVFCLKKKKTTTSHNMNTLTQTYK